MRVTPIGSTVDVYASEPIRMWTVAEGDCVASPTPYFYHRQMVTLSNEGNTVCPKWVALDRYNGDLWKGRRIPFSEVAPMWELIRRTGELERLRQRPEPSLPPAAPAPRVKTFLRRSAGFLAGVAATLAALGIVEVAVRWTP